MRLFDHMISPPDKTEIWQNILTGNWPGLETRPVNLPSGKDLGLGVVATRTFRKGAPVAHYPSTDSLSKQSYFDRELFKDPRVANYAQEMEGPQGPKVLLAHEVSANDHYGQIINHTPCTTCCNLTQVAMKIDDDTHLIFRAKRRISPGDQLLRDYGAEYKWPGDKVECPKCGTIKDTVPKVYIYK